MPKRHTFLILVHNQPQRVSALLDALDHPAFDTFVHVDAKSPYDFETVISPKQMIRRHRIRWGGVAMVRATLDLLEIARSSGPYATFTLLSGSDYPIKSPSEIRARLDSITTSRLDCWHDKIPHWHKRYQRYFFNDIPGWTGRILNGLSRRAARFLPARSFISDLKPWFGSQWWTLTTEGADAVLTFARDRPDFRRFCRNVHIPDELFFQTAIMNSLGESGVRTEPLRYLDWSERKAHPKTLTLEDFDALSASDALFARKFEQGFSESLVQEINEHTLVPA